MKALFLTTYTPNNDIFWRSLECAGWEVTPHRHDERSHHDGLLALARQIEPRMIVYVGALEWVGISNPIPSPEILRSLRDAAPTVLLCGDSSDGAWNALAEEYRARECFDVYVSMDGSERPGYVPKLTPVDVRPYAPRPWDQRTVAVGYTGGRGGEKGPIIDAIGAQHAGDAAPHDAMARFMCDCRIIVNAPRTGSGDADHVKGRVVETGFAGACLLERRNAAIARWFEPGFHYVEFSDASDAARMMQWISANDATARQIAQNLMERVVALHHPAVFWRDIAERAGVSS